MKYLVTLACLFGLWFTAKSQNELTGQVRDSLTREPVPFANVFFANTSIGTVSNEKGEFVLRNFPSGKYDLVVSFIGFKTVSRSLTFTDQPQSLTVSLQQEITQLQEVVLTPNYSQKASDIRLFIKYFIGDNRNAQDCKLVNEKDLVAYEDDDVHALMAFARAPLEIKNEALGYKLFYELDNFEVNYASLTQTYAGIPRFEELTPKKLSQKRKWEDERKRAYEGSFVHLIHCLRKGIMNGPFELHELHKIPNPERLPEEFLKAKVNYWRKKTFKGGTIVVYDSKSTKDSLGYYVNLYNVPPFIDSLGRLFTAPEQLLDETRDHFTFTGLLHVVYKGEREEQMYKTVYQTNHGNEQHSILLFKNKGVSIYDNGYYEPLQDVFFDGYMMWSDRISNLLPREYVPGKP